MVESLNKMEQNLNIRQFIQNFDGGVQKHIWKQEKYNEKLNR